MPRARQRATLEQGLKLDLNRLIRQGAVRPGAKSGPFSIQWTNTWSGEEVASGIVTANLEGAEAGFRIQIESLDQRISLTTQPRPFGGLQWYFRCPITQRRCSMLWMPPGANRFCSRQAWRGQVAYASQFESPGDRAERARAKIKARLIGNNDPDDWDLPPKPKWMRWRTYKQHVQRFESYEDVIEEDMFRQLIRLGIRG
jgi:hypothetical protein